MSAIEFLLNRSSQSKLLEPGPTPSDLEKILTAGLRAPDHAMLRPYQFWVHQGEGRQALANTLVRAVKNDPNSDEALLSKAKNAPFRAPVIITVVAKVKEHPKVPAIEQKLTAGCAVMAMQQAARALGYGGIWRTGPFARDPYVKEALNAAEQDEIVGFLYLGSLEHEPKAHKLPELAQFVEYVCD